jgi:hypothetical protein
MTDAIDEARAKVHDKLVSVVLATVIYGGKSEEVLSAHAAVMAAADRLALTYVRAAHQLACHSPCLTPGNCKFDGLFARLEGGSHAD